MPPAPALFLAFLLCLVPAWAASAPAVPARQEEPRSFLTFLPSPDTLSAVPSSQLVQLLLDRQARDGHESYLLQVLFRGRPAGIPVHRVFDDRVEIDFLDTEKPSMRLARVRGGVIEATSLRELHYRDPVRDSVRTSGGGPAARSRRMVRLVLHTRAKPALKIRNTLDRTLIHFRVPSAASGPVPDSTAPTVRVPAKKPADR
jgi:hypothetical protein